MLNAILYLIRTGCPWDMLPKEFPPKTTVYGYLRRFCQDGIRHRLWMILLMQTREQAGKAGSPTPSVFRSRSSFMPPTSRIVMGRPWLVIGSSVSSLGCTASSPMPAIKAPSLQARLPAQGSSSRSSNGCACRRLRGCSKTLGDRKDLRMARLQPPSCQRYRATDRNLDRHGRRRHHPTPRQKIGKQLKCNECFSNGL